MRSCYGEKTEETDKIDEILNMSHVAIIMDGNGRWAKQRGLERIEGHRAGRESVKEAIKFAAQERINYLSLFAFSEENWNRPEDEVSGLMEMMAQAIIEELQEIKENNVKIRIIGDLSRISPDLRDMIGWAENSTASNSGLTVIIFLSYSGKWDILQAAQNMIKENVEINSSSFESYLVTSGIPDPDLLIRTSGEKRISNFMLWQCAYTEFVFLDTLWPDFRKTQFQLALDEYNSRERRYGKTSAQIEN